jgi:hypothetical protein
MLVGITALVLLNASRPAHAVPVCGPGPHWVDNCPSGVDQFPSLGFHGIDLNLDGVADATLNFAGPTTIFRGPGSPHRIDAELVSAVLQGGGITLVAGDGVLPDGTMVRNSLVDPTLNSPGSIVETSDPNVAHSIFNVRFELQGTPFGPLRNKVPAMMEADITFVPPIGRDYVCMSCPLGLFDFGPDGIFSNSDDVLRAQLVNAVHTPTVPEPSTLLLFGSGLAALVYRQLRRSKAS